VIADGRLFYRGLDAVQLAEAATLEDVARRLWDARAVNPFAQVRPRVGAVPGGSIRARLFAALARRAEEDADPKARTVEALRLECARVLDEAVGGAAGSGRTRTLWASSSPSTLRPFAASRTASGAPPAVPADWTT